MTAKTPDELLYDAAEQLQLGKLARARALCEKALAARPDAEGLALLSQIASADERPDDAIAALERAGALAPRRREIWSRLATLYMTARRWADTEAAAARALALEPFEGTARSTAALAALEQGRLDDAWYHWAILELTGDALLADGVAIAIEGAIDGATDGEIDNALDAAAADPAEAARARARARADADFPRERASRALHVAVRGGDLDGVRAALAAGADPGAPDDDRGTPLLYAAADGALEIVRALLDAGADPNPLRVETMFVAVLDTPLERARHYKHKKVVKLLIERGAKERDQLPDPQVLYLAEHGTPDQRLVDALWRDDAELVRRALADGADPNGAAHGDERVLAAAVRLRKPAFVALLLAAGADPNTLDDGAPLLHGWMRDDEAVACAIALLDGGADPNRVVKRASVLSSLPPDAAPRARLARALVAHGLDLALTDGDGRTLLAIAVDDGDDLELVELLLARGADPRQRVGKEPLLARAEHARGAASKQILARLRAAAASAASPASPAS